MAFKYEESCAASRHTSAILRLQESVLGLGILEIWGL